MRVGNLLIRAADWHADRIATIFDGGRFTYRQYNERVNALSHALLDLGIQYQNRTAILSHNCHQYMELIFASAKTGTICVLLNTRLSAKDLAFLIKDSNPKVLFVSKRLKPIWDELSPLIPRDICCISIDGKIEGMPDYDDLITGYPTCEPLIKDDIQGDDVFMQIYTSGTTGRPKGTLHTNKNIYTWVVDYSIALPYTKFTHYATPFPLFHVANWSSFVAVYLGFTHSYFASFDPAKYMEHLEREKVTEMGIAATMLRMLIDHPDFGKRDFGSLRGIINGAGPITMKFIKEVKEKLPSVTFYNIYGTSETGGLSILDETVIVKGGPEYFQKKLGSVGRHFVNVSMKILDDEDKECPAGVMGQICVAGDHVMKGYHNMPELTAEILKNGMYHTGDLGYVDADGYFYIVDRKNDMIISGGENIYPSEVEQIILGMEGVSDVVVIGIPDHKWGEAVKAIIIPEAGVSITEDRVIEHCKKQHLAGYKRPKSVDFVQQFPKNAAGKIMRRELRSKYWENE
jgi:acyl-CoA synthetase (AMP-forming)/AMP-acid ligase II